MEEEKKNNWSSIIIIAVSFIAFAVIVGVRSINKPSREKNKKHIERLISEQRIVIDGNKVSFPKNTDNQLLNDWVLYEIGTIGRISIPSTMEFFDENSVFAFKEDVLKEDIASHYKIDVNILDSDLKFQPKGTNNLDDDALSKYALILINYDKGKKDDFYKWDEDFELYCPRIFKDYDMDMEQLLRKNVAAMGGKVKIVEWFGVEIGNFNDLSYVKYSYIRQTGNNPAVKVNTYNFFNSDEAVTITLSYRLSESDIWASDFSKIPSTFDFITKK